MTSLKITGVIEFESEIILILENKKQEVSL